MNAYTEITREQDAYAEALALEFVSVEVRMLADGVMSAIGRRDDGTMRIDLVNEDGERLSASQSIARHKREEERAAEAIGALDRRCDDFAERVLAVFADAMHAFPQYDDKFTLDVWTVGYATKRFTTKGGLVCEPGDVILVGAFGGSPLGTVDVFSARRLVQCSGFGRNGFAEWQAA